MEYDLRTGFDISEIQLVSLAKRKFLAQNRFHIFWVVTGNCIFFRNGRQQSCGREELILLQPGNQLELGLSKKQNPVRLIWLQIEENLLEELSDAYTDLLYSFRVVPFGAVAVLADSSTAMITRNLAHKLYTSSKEHAFGNHILLRGNLSMLLVLVLRACIAVEFKKSSNQPIHFLLDDVFVFIREHLEEDITLGRLEQEFFISHEHIAREFKRQTGNTVHQYILQNRLEQSCRYLKEGHSVVNVWGRCGFNSYSYFFQAFKRRYGVTPKTYASEN